MPGRERFSRTTRGAFRKLMTASYVGEIQQAFQDEGFTPDPDCPYVDSSERRTAAEEYLSNIKWTDETVYQLFRTSAG